MVLSMRVLSYNVRGLGSRAKCREVRELIKTKKNDFCCIQESKLELVDELRGRAIWGEGNFGWTFRESEGRSGGIISICNTKSLSVISCWSMNRAVIVNCLWGAERVECCIVNVYAPCDLLERIDLWERILQILPQNPDCRICIAGNFNSVRFSTERAGRREAVCRRELEVFYGFIMDTGLIDLPLHGRSFSWYRPDGSCKSRLDRFLVNNCWLS